MDLKQNLKKIATARGSTVVVVIVGEVVVGLLIFHAGVAYGERHAFGRMHGFGGTPPPGFSLFSHSFIPEGHGAVGTIVKIATSTVTIQTRDGGTEVVAIRGDTEVQGHASSTAADLTVGLSIAVIGEPSKSAANQIDAKLVRILPPIQNLELVHPAEQE
jgi:hypothetical protein